MCGNISDHRPAWDCPTNGVVAADELREGFETAVVPLPERQRRVLELRYVEEHDQREVAAKLGVSDRTVRNDEDALRRHLAALREAA